MTDYVLQQQSELAKALREREAANRKVEVMEGRYDRAKNHNVGGGRSAGRGGPTQEELKQHQEGGQVKSQTVKMRKGGKVSASSRADGIAQRGKTRGVLR